MSGEFEPKAEADGAGEGDLSRVLRAAGRRIEPPADMKEEMYAALHAQWRAMLAERRHSSRRRRQMFAAAAGIAAVAVAGWLLREPLIGSGRAVASLGGVFGAVSVDRGWLVAERAAQSGQQIYAGDEVRTGRAAGAQIELAGGIRLQFDADTHVAFASPQRLLVDAGAAYVDVRSSAAAQVTPLSIETPLGVVRHLGTQYEVRLAGAGLQVTVREGRVELTGRDGAKQTGAAGERLTLGADGQLVRTSVSPDAPDWRWAGIAPGPFVIENRPLAQFLTWVGQQLGREIVYSTADSEAEAQRVILRGSIAGLTPEQALTAVLSTTRLRSRIEAGRIVIHFD